MSPRPRTDRPRHLAGPQHLVNGSHTAHLAGGARAATLASGQDDFDVEAAFAPDFDFDSVFDDLDGTPEPVVPVARPRRHRVALAVAVSLAAIPLIVIDNLGATAETAAPRQVETGSAETLDTPATFAPVLAQIVVDPTPTTLAPVVTTTTVLAVAPTVQAPPTTVVKALAAPVTTAAPRPTTTTTTAPPPTTVAPAPVASRPGDPNDPASWDALAECETGGNWAANTGNGYYGGLQFSQSSWDNVGGSGRPDEASKATQIEMGKRLQARQGWAAWRTCARKLGYID